LSTQAVQRGAGDATFAVKSPFDGSLIAELGVPTDADVEDATAQFEDCQYATVLERTERWFWSFCDDYLELVKSRRYGAQGPELASSANSALLASLSVILRLFAPFLPFVTEEVWSWWQPGSVHRSSWPGTAEISAAIGDDDEEAERALERAREVLDAIRKAKSEGKVPQRTPALNVIVSGAQRDLGALRSVESDLRAAGVKSPLIVLLPSDDARARSALLDAQGIAVFRRDDGRTYVALDYGHSGGGHGHPDRLNLLLSDGDTRWLDDYGTGSYVDPSLHWYRSTLAHNAPMVDGA
jgi:hypothetical protein